MRRGVRLREIGAHESRVLPKSVELALRAARGRGFRCIRDLRGARDVAHTMVRFIQDAAWFTDRFQKGVSEVRRRSAVPGESTSLVLSGVGAGNSWGDGSVALRADRAERFDLVMVNCLASLAL